MERITPAQALSAIGSYLRRGLKVPERLAAIARVKQEDIAWIPRSKHNTRGNLSYKPGFFNRPGTKLVRKWYGEEAARRYNS